MVIDFAKNYAHVSQNEPQSAHWDRRQTTMHPICINFRCTEDNCKELVTLEMVCFTEDLKHDSLAVKTFEDAAENYLRSIGIPVNVIFQWSIIVQISTNRNMLLTYYLHQQHQK